MKSIFRISAAAAVIVQYCLSADLPDKEKAEVQTKKLILVSEIILPFTEPSGIAWSDRMQNMWIVSGGDQHIYRLDAGGSVIQRLPYIGTDLEGIAFDETDSTLWLVDEREKEIIHLSLDGFVLLEKKLPYGAKKNKGPEGITIGPKNRMYVINESDPSILMQLNENYDINWTIALNFASDYSDISYDKNSGMFFIISDKSEAFFSWTLERGILCKYILPNDKNEGIAYDNNHKIFYIVNDKISKLYFYKSE
ncbi:MAG: SdiA-regulated domain-containing protein [Bacteroidetes bacterium]|nr:SdiA-regulated domain-containing protein [Bacteroidota bacterium]